MGRGTEREPQRGTKRARVLWRFRRNPLRSRSYAVEAWALLAAAVLAVAGGAVAGYAAGRGVVASTDRQRAERHQVGAVLTGEPVESFGTDSGRRATVVWTGPDGTRHTARTRVEAGVHRGDRVPVWVDRDAVIVPAPLPVVLARIEGVLTGLTAAAGVGGLVVVVCATATSLADRRRSERWAAEWDEVGPRWDRHTA